MAKTRFIQSIVKTAARSTAPMPWQRGDRRRAPLVPVLAPVLAPAPRRHATAV